MIPLADPPAGRGALILSRGPFCGAEEIRPLRFMLRAAAYMISDQEILPKAVFGLAAQGMTVRRQNVRHLR